MLNRNTASTGLCPLFVESMLSTSSGGLECWLPCLKVEPHGPTSRRLRLADCNVRIGGKGGDVPHAHVIQCALSDNNRAVGGLGVRINNHLTRAPIGNNQLTPVTKDGVV